MAHQFIHYECYALKPRTKQSSAAGVVAEAERIPSHSKHVSDPKRPKLLFGVNPSAMLHEIEQAAAGAKDRTGKRKLPRDTPLLLAGVASMPLRSEDLLKAFAAFRKDDKREKPSALRQFDKWQKLTVRFLQERYMGALKSVVLHYDEEYVHLHWYVGPGLRNGTCNLDGLDVAGDAERALKLSRKERNQSGALRKKVRATALRAFQDAYFDSVGNVLGWLRLGPENPRMTKQQYVRETKSAAALLAANEKAEALAAEVDALKGSLATSRKLYADAIRKVAPEVQDLRREVAVLRYRPDPKKVEQTEHRLKELASRLRPAPRP